MISAWWLLPVVLIALCVGGYCGLRIGNYAAFNLILNCLDALIDEATKTEREKQIEEKEEDGAKRDD